MLAIDPQNDTWEYVAECDRQLDDSDQTVWILKNLDPKEEANLEDALGQVNSDGGYKLTIGSQARMALDYGLKEVRNFKDSNGNDVKVERINKKIGGVYPIDDKFLSRIPKAIRSELANAITRGMKLDEEEQKN